MQVSPSVRAGLSSIVAFDLAQVIAITGGDHVLPRDEAKRRGVDAVAQAAAVAGPVRKDVAQVAVAVRRTHLGPYHPVRDVPELLDVRPLDRFREARPAAARFVLVRRGEERLARHDVDVDAWLLVVQVLARSGTFGAALLSDAVLLRGEL